MTLAMNMKVSIIADRQSNSRILTDSMRPAIARPERRRVTSATWQSISWRSYHLRKPSLRMLEVGSKDAAARSGEAGLGRLAVCVVARAHHRTARRVGEPHFRGLLPECPELVGMREARDRQVVPGRLQVLADREHVDVVRAQVAHHLED